MNEDILHAPIVSVSTKGRVPRKPRGENSVTCLFQLIDFNKINKIL